MSKDITASKTQSLKIIRSAINRATELRTGIVTKGRYEDPIGQYHALPNTDKRDFTVFIFFELAAAFENFSQESFILATRKKYRANPKNAERIAGTIDRGLSGVMGWGAPTIVVSRARHLFDKVHFLSRLEQELPPGCYQVLNNAHRVRNRIAHPGEKARTEVNTLLAQMGVPLLSRKGLSMGRLLSDYPQRTGTNDRWFSRFIAAYGHFADLIEQKL